MLKDHNAVTPVRLNPAPVTSNRPPDKCILKLFSLFLTQNICCGHPKHMFKIMGKKIIKIRK